MLLTCIFPIFLIAPSSVKISGAETSEVLPSNFDSAAYSEEDDETGAAPEDFFYEESDKEESGGIVRRAVRRYPEESEHVEVGHQQVSIPLSQTECNCPDILARGTLVAIVATLAFLGFFSTSVLLVVAVCILRVMERQRKKGKEVGAKHAPTKRPLPPVPPPRPEHTYTTVKPCAGYERLHSVSPHTTEGVYLNASELNPGPRTRREQSYQNVKEPTPKSSPANEYAPPESRQSLSTPPLVHKYANVAELQSGPISGEGSPEPGTTPKGRETHIYEEVE